MLQVVSRIQIASLKFLSIYWNLIVINQNLPLMVTLVIAFIIVAKQMKFEENKRLPVIKESEELRPRASTNRFNSNEPIRKSPAQKTTQNKELFDFLKSSTKDILHDYETNPFFKAKLKYLLKTTPALAQSLPYEHRLPDLPLHTYKHCTRTANQEF